MGKAPLGRKRHTHECPFAHDQASAALVPAAATTDCYPDDHAPTPPRDSLPWSGDWTGTTRLRPPFRRWLHRRKVAGGLLSFASRLAVSRGSARASRAAARSTSVKALLISASCPVHAVSVEPLRVRRQRRWFAEGQSREHARPPDSQIRSAKCARQALPGARAARQAQHHTSPEHARGERSAVRFAAGTTASGRPRAGRVASHTGFSRGHPARSLSSSQQIGSGTGHSHSAKMRLASSCARSSIGDALVPLRLKVAG